MRKYLTILSGHPRGGEKTWNSLYRNVIEPLNSDLAVLTGNKWIANQSFVEKATINGFLMNQMIGLVITRKDIMEIGKNILNLVEILYYYIIQDLYTLH